MNTNLFTREELTRPPFLRVRALDSSFICPPAFTRKDPQEEVTSEPIFPLLVEFIRSLTGSTPPADLDLLTPELLHDVPIGLSQGPLPPFFARACRLRLLLLLFFRRREIFFPYSSGFRCFLSDPSLGGMRPPHPSLSAKPSANPAPRERCSRLCFLRRFPILILSLAPTSTILLSLPRRSAFRSAILFACSTPIVSFS